MINDATPLWRDMDDASREVAYSPSSVLPDRDLMPFIQAYVDKSVKAYAACSAVQTLRYGPHPSNTIDLVMPAPKPAPCHVFIHGGYWQELSKRESFFPACDFIANDIGFAAVDYTLAPEASVDQIVQECVAAVTELHENAEVLGIDPARIVLSGSSAGAHLVAMVCLSLPKQHRPNAVVLLSGIYELEPLLGTDINDALSLDIEAAHRNSPALQDLSGFPKTILTWGAQETDEFKRQSRAFAQMLPDVEAFETSARNHFDIVFDLANDSKLGRKIKALMIG